MNILSSIPVKVGGRGDLVTFHHRHAATLGPAKPKVHVRNGAMSTSCMREYRPGGRYSKGTTPSKMK